MINVTSSRGIARSVLAALCMAAVFAATAQAKGSKKVLRPGTWNLADEFPLTKENPAPDQYGDTKVWTYADGAGKLKYFFDASEEEARCGVKEFFEWDALKHSVTGTPAIWYNAGPSVAEGEDACDPSGAFPAKTVFMAPEAFGSELEGVVRWKSPGSGTVTVSGSVQLVDSNPTQRGIRWEVLQGSSTLTGGATYEQNLMTFGPVEVSVAAKEYLTLEIRRIRPELNGDNDAAAVNWTITSP
jgi:hypothetical protein